MASQVQKLVGIARVGKMVLRAQIEKIGLTMIRTITRSPIRAMVYSFILIKSIEEPLNTFKHFRLLSQINRRQIVIVVLILVGLRI